MSSRTVLTVLRRRPEWAAAVNNLLDLLTQHGDLARRRAEGYGQLYQGRRGSMVLDVVTSRQRRYLDRVVPLVTRWEADSDDRSMRWLAAHPPVAARYGLRPSEPSTISKVALNMVSFADDLGVDEDEGCRRWADTVAGLEHAAGLDPVVGAVPGIGPALFAYMRMRCGSDALKPDLRVASAMRRLGFRIPADSHAILLVARAAAAEAQIGLLTLDQLLWWAEEIE